MNQEEEEEYSGLGLIFFSQLASLICPTVSNSDRVINDVNYISYRRLQLMSTVLHFSSACVLDLTNLAKLCNCSKVKTLKRLINNAPLTYIVVLVPTKWMRKQVLVLVKRSGLRKQAGKGKKEGGKLLFLLGKKTKTH